MGWMGIEMFGTGSQNAPRSSKDFKSLGHEGGSALRYFKATTAITGIVTNCCPIEVPLSRGHFENAGADPCRKP